MATLNAYSRMTLAELASRTNNGNVIEIAEILNKSNPIFTDMLFREANSSIGDKISRRLSLPAGTWRRVNQGVAVEASQTQDVIEGIGLLEARSEIDKEIVDLSGDPVNYRRTEDMAFVEGLGQTAATALFYGNVNSDPEQFNGLATRLAALETNRVFSAGGSGSDLTSVYVVKWGPQYCYGIYPKGSNVGLDMEDLGVGDALDGNGLKYRAYMSRFVWHLGLTVKDNRAIKRIANIETAGSSNIFDEDYLIAALNHLPGGPDNAVIYCNATIATQMDIIAKDKSNVNYTRDDVFGVPTTLFRGVPVRKCDSILNTESAIS
jgi:hypothetical protein